MSAWVWSQQPAERKSSGLEIDGVVVHLGGNGSTCPSCHHGYACTRPLGHPGRHIATIARGTGICAAWPGDHEPTADDLTTVPS